MRETRMTHRHPGTTNAEFRITNRQSPITNRKSRIKSGGREPAVRVRETYLQERRRTIAGDCRYYAHDRRCIRVQG